MLAIRSVIGDMTVTYRKLLALIMFFCDYDDVYTDIHVKNKIYVNF
jgi:hypothetical protein